MNQKNIYYFCFLNHIEVIIEMEIVFLLIGVLIGAAASYFVSRSRIVAAEALLDAEREHLAEVKADAQQRLQAYKAEAEKRQQEQMTMVREQVESLTRSMLQERSEELMQTNKVNMDVLLTPMRENIKHMEHTMAGHRDAAIHNSASLQQAVESMMMQTKELGTQADRLSNALQRKNKTAGNWGELILTDLLESQGLVEGMHFDAQWTMRDETGNSLRNEDSGRRMIPDVVLHLADNRDVVIDSKMSLVAFTDYQNAETEPERHEAAVRHLESVRQHVRELAAKRYNDYIRKPRVSADFVIMFVPIDAALQLALAEQGDLWKKAFDQKVFICSSQTLIAALHIIDLTWINVQQERNTQKVMDEARKLIDRVEQFYALFVNVGRKIGEAQEAYAKVVDKVKDGKQTILASGRNLETLGVRGKKPLPTIEEE